MSVSNRIYCPVCNNDGQDVTFNERQFLHEHLENLHGYFKCSLCPVVVYVSPESLEQHNSRFHQGELVVEVEQVVDRTKSAKRKNVENYPSSPKHFKHETEFRTELGHELSEPYIDTSTLTEGVFCQPSRYSRDPLRGFFLQTILECKECPLRPTKKFATHNAWQLHIKTFHKHMKTMSDYKSSHGDPDLVKFRHQCRLCMMELVLNLSVVKRHLKAQHQTSLTSYMTKYREELIKEKLGRPIVPPSHTIEGWWEGCMYNCKICDQTFPAQMAFENHLSSSHGITGQREIEAKYTDVWGRLSSLTRAHQCYICRKVIRHEYKVIFQHLSKHKLDLEAYACRFRDKLVQELTDKGMAYILERETDSQGIISLQDYLARNKSAVDTPDPMDGWYDCSEHKCALCENIFWSNLRFHWHIKREHGIVSTKEYRKQHGDPEVTLRQHKCQICHNLIKWEASRIRDHLKFHKDPKDKLSLKEYGERFRDYILHEVTKVKIPTENSKQSTSEEEISPVDATNNKSGVAKSGHVIVGDTPDSGYTVKEWKELFCKKVSPDDKVECNLCKRTMNRHSFTRHQERAHKGILNMRDLNRLKRKQLQMAQSGVIKSLSELMRWAGGVAVVKGKGDCKEEVDLEMEDQESRLNLYKAGLTLEQIESKVDLINSGLTITKATTDKFVPNVPEGGEFIEIENEAEVETSYPTYVVDQDTGEILIVEQITGFDGGEGRDSPDSGSRSPDNILPDDIGQGSVKSGAKEQDAVALTVSNNNLKKEILENGSDFDSCMLADVEKMPSVWQGEQGETSYNENEVQSEEDDNVETETGPLDGQIMQIDLPDKKFGGSSVGELNDDIMVNFEQVRFIRLEQEEQELEEEMLQSELETEYVLEDGQLRKIEIHERTSPLLVYNQEEEEGEDKIEKLESVVMLAEDGSARIVVGGDQKNDHADIGDQYILSNNDVHYVLGHEDEGKFVLHNLDLETGSVQLESSQTESFIQGQLLVQESSEEDVTVGDEYVLEQKDVGAKKQISLNQKLKEIKRKNLLLERRDQQVDVEEGEVIHQSQLLDDDGLVTGYLVLGDGDQLVLGNNDEQVVHEGGQEMVFVGEDQIVFKDGETFLNVQPTVIPEQSNSQEATSVPVNKQLEGEQELTETNHYIQVVEQEEAELNSSSDQTAATSQTCTRLTGGWEELGGSEQEYDRKFVSKPRVEANGRVSQGTVVCQWTKMPGDRVRVAHSKVIRPRVGQQEQGDMLDMNSLETSSAFPETISPPAGDISSPLVFSSLGSVWRDVGCQVVPHKVSGLPSDREEERKQVDRIKQFLGCGGVLDRSCPGCGKVMSRQRNLVTHLKVLHGVEVQGPEGEEHMVRYSKENIRVQCDICNKTISRKSIRRHVNLCHPSSVSMSRFTKEKSKPH